MRSVLVDDFLDRFRRLPEPVREQARRAYRLWKANPHHPSLRFKQVHATEPVFSVRVGLGWRALGLVEGGTITWFWIGSHAEYDQILE